MVWAASITSVSRYVTFGRTAAFLNGGKSVGKTHALSARVAGSFSITLDGPGGIPLYFRRVYVELIPVQHVLLESLRAASQLPQRKVCRHDHMIRFSPF